MISLTEDFVYIYYSSEKEICLKNYSPIQAVNIHMQHNSEYCMKSTAGILYAEAECRYFFRQGLTSCQWGDTVSPPTTDVTRILQFIPQPKGVEEFLLILLIVYRS